MVGRAPGRGESLFVQAGACQWVIRPYRRGGLAARLSRERYLWTGIEATRAFRELRLTATLFDQGLPVPRPVAACVTRQGLTYTATLITERLPQAQPLAALLDQHSGQASGENPGQNSAPVALLEAVGAMIRRFHAAGLDHVDLNARNILVTPDQTPWLIDFDRCRIRPQGKWQEANLARLARSVAKFTAQPDVPIQAIEQGYRQARR